MTTLSLLKETFTDITSDSRAVKKGGLFLAYPGDRHDGRNYIEKAIEAGAACVFWESKIQNINAFEWQAKWKIKNVAIENLKQKVGEIAAEFYQHPSKKCLMIGVTGTNGKTSVSQWIGQCLTWLGQKTAVIGTIGNGFSDEQKQAINTTPDAILLQKMLSEYVENGAKAVSMEVSSHGLSQGRVNGVKFDVAILTNLTRDHLDYHQTMQAYAAAKRSLFDWPSLKTAILNADDTFGKSIIDEFAQIKKPYVSYGLVDADVVGTELILHENGLSMKVKTPKGAGLLEASVLGEFNAYNLLAVLATLISVDIDLASSLAAIKTIRPVAGRMQQFGGGERPLVVIDYAHTPDALEKVLITLNHQLKAQKKQGKLTCVFGCGGDRDAGKRPLMGQVATMHADVIIVTSDNPRSEAPEGIIQDIIQNLTGNLIVQADRAKAIEQAILQANAGDIVLVAGKGHEDYQEIAGVKYAFSDQTVVKKVLSQRNHINEVPT